MRRQLPTYSPLGLGDWVRALVETLGVPEEGRRRLASLLSHRYGSESVVLTGSGTQALELAIRTARREQKPDSPVALPAYSCFDVVTASVGARVPVLFYDVDPGTLSPDMEGLRDTLRAGAGTVVVSNLYGFPVDWDGLKDLCTENGAILVEDAAQGLGSTWRRREGGTFGDLTVLSFGRGKGWTGGGGGALLVRLPGVGMDEVLLDPASGGEGQLGTRAAVLSLAQWALGRPCLYGLPSALPWLALGETVYREPVPIRTIPSFSGALALATAEASASAVSGRRARARELEALLGLEDLSLPFRPVRPLPGGEPSYLRMPMLCEEGAKPLLASPVARAQGILPGYPRPLPDLEAAASFLVRPGEGYPGAEQLSRRLFTLPTHSLLQDGDLAKMSAMLRSVDPAPGRSSAR